MFAKWKSLLLSLTLLLTLGLTTSCGSSGTNISISGLQGPNVSLLNDSILVSLVFENIQIDGGLRYSIPKYTESYLELSPDATSGGTYMSISISLNDVLNGDLSKLDPQYLPGGRNLPNISGGKLPAVAFSVEKFNNMSFYLGSNVFGIFLPVDVGVDQTITSFRYYINSKAAGTISLVGKDTNGENSGVLLMLNITTSVKKKLIEINNKFH
jgi:hypothetical protein